MTLVEAQDCILLGQGANERGNIILNSISVTERTKILRWIQKNVDRHILEKLEPVTFDEILPTTEMKVKESGKINLPELLFVLHEIQKLIQSEPSE